MISGTVNANREGRVRLRIQGTEGREQEVEAVIANGQSELFDIYEATVIWDGQPRTVETDAADTDSLMGMSLIYGYELRVQAIDGGRVTIEAIS